jgi:hypothetical protein
LATLTGLATNYSQITSVFQFKFLNPRIEFAEGLGELVGLPFEVGHRNRRDKFHFQLRITVLSGAGLLIAIFPVISRSAIASETVVGLSKGSRRIGSTDAGVDAHDLDDPAKPRSMGPRAKATPV